MRIRLVAVAMLFLCAGSRLAAAEGEFRPLFDGKSLAGWSGDKELWRVEGEEVVGTTDGHPLEHNTFLATEKPYKNFVLRLKFKLRNGNSGVQFRSQRFDDHVVKGYQADIADKRYMGILYEEGGRGILVDVDPEVVAEHFDPSGWNEYEIAVDGPRIVQKLNGFTTVDYTEESDEGAKEGVIALQLHVGPDMEVRFRDVRIRELN